MIHDKTVIFSKTFRHVPIFNVTPFPFHIFATVTNRSLDSYSFCFVFFSSYFKFSWVDVFSTHGSGITNIISNTGG